MHIRVDASSIRPGHSAGVEAFASGLLNGLAEGVPGRTEVIIERGTGARWQEMVAHENVTWNEVALPFGGLRGIDRRLRRVVPANVRSSRLVRQAVTGLRSRANPIVAGDHVVTLYPFHRVPVRAPRSVVTLHDLRAFQPEFRSRFDMEVIRGNVERASAVVVSWPHPFQQVLGMFPEARAKTVLIPLPAFHGRKLRPGVQRDRGLLLYPSSTAPHKNHLVLLEAMAMLSEFRLCCPGPLAEPQATVLSARAGESDLARRVSLPGFVPAAELEQLYTAASAVVIPSRWEAASGAMFEAFSWGIPVACADVAPLRAQVEFAGGDASFFDATSPPSIVEAVRRLFAEWERYAAASARAGSRLANRTWADTARDYAEVFTWVAGGCDGPIPRSSFVTESSSRGAI